MELPQFPAMAALEESRKLGQEGEGMGESRKEENSRWEWRHIMFHYGTGGLGIGQKMNLGLWNAEEIPGWISGEI